MQSPGPVQKFVMPGAGGAVLAGLLVTQILSTATVYLSNLQLHRKIIAINDAGYLPVPGLDTLPPLTSFAAAFWGGLFFTLSAGAGLSVATCIAARLFPKPRAAALAFLLLIWLGLLYTANADGLTLFAGLFFLLVPPAVFFVARRGFAPQKSIRVWLLRVITAAPVVLLAIFWLTRMDARLFEDIRDHLLLKNRVGTAINDFYYRYTLYPAEVFKPLSHKTLRTCHLRKIESPDERAQLSATLRSRDYLEIGDESAADLVAEKKDGQLVLLEKNRPVLTAAPELFAAEASTLLAEFSMRTDRFEFFRIFTFYGILVGFPILLYLGIHGLLRLLCSLFLNPLKAVLIASACCLIAGVGAWIPVYQAGRVDITEQNVREAIDSGSWRMRIAALRYIEANPIEIRHFPAYRKLLKSPRIQERYWLARALGSGRDRDSFQALLFLLNDPHPNVVCQALYALGKRGDPTVIAAVIQTVKTSDSWYVQRYGYNTIRKLGWQQPAST